MPSRLRVMHVIAAYGEGGAARVALNIVTHLDRDAFEVHVVCMRDVPPTDYVREILDGTGITSHIIGKRPGFDPRAVRALDRVVRAVRPRIVHSHGSPYRYVLPVTVVRGGVHHVHTLHSLAATEASATTRRINRVAFRRWVTPVSIANAVSKSMVAEYGIHDFPVIHNGIPVERFQRPTVDRSTWRSRHGFGDDDILVVCVAMLRPEKDHALLVESCAQLASSQLHLVLVGSGPLAGAIEAQAERLGFGAHVHLLGERGDVPEILGASDVFALSSWYEGNPLSIQEAMAAGLPVVATAVGGTTEILGDGVEGVLVPTRNASAFTEALARLLGDAGLRARMGAAAAARARAEFSAARMANEYADLYRRLAGVTAG